MIVHKKIITNHAISIDPCHVNFLVQFTVLSLCCVHPQKDEEPG